MSASAAALSDIQAVQAALQVMSMLQLSSHRFPPECSAPNASISDYIVIGAGTAGSVLANRLTASGEYNVLLIEAGGPAPFEAELAGLYAYLPDTKYDYNFTSIPDNYYPAQNLQRGRFHLTQGKMLGGSSSLAHHVHVRGNPHDYDFWAENLNDPGWQYDNVLPYFKKAEKILDKEFINSAHGKQYGTDGPIELTRERSPINEPFLEAFKELGNIVDTDVVLGFNEPLMSNANNLRQSTAVTYLSEAKTRPNLCVMTNTMATKILIKGDVAIGVQVIDANGDTKVYYANKEVIVSAGTINSPKLLMLSGIGPKDHLETLGIDVVADLPVGKNFMDQTTAMLIYNLESNTSPPPPLNPYKFPVPMTTGYVALDPEQTYPDYQSYNLAIPAQSPAYLELCSKLFKFTDSFCDRLYGASVGRNTLMSCITFLSPKSKGEVLLASTDPNDSPLIYTRTYSEKSDLKLMAAFLEDHNKVLDTSIFKSFNASLAEIEPCTGKTSDELWECYALATTSTTMHIAGTNAMGSVLDSKLRVEGVQNLRVIDASAMPTLTTGNPHGAVLMMAERGAAYILG